MSGVLVATSTRICLGCRPHFCGNSFSPEDKKAADEP